MNLLIVSCLFPVPAVLMESTNLFTHWCWTSNKKRAKKTRSRQGKMFQQSTSQRIHACVAKKIALLPETRILHGVLFPKISVVNGCCFGGKSSLIVCKTSVTQCSSGANEGVIYQNLQYDRRFSLKSFQPTAKYL